LSAANCQDVQPSPLQALACPLHPAFIRGEADAQFTLSGNVNSFWVQRLQDLINMFNDHELELLISGLPEIDVDDLRANTEYTGYTPAAKQIQWFWELVSALSKEDLALLVQFVTGTSKVPLEGFKALQVTRTTILSVHLSGPVWILTPSVLEIKLTTFRNLQ